MGSTISLSSKVEIIGSGLKDVYGQVAEIKGATEGTSKSIETFWNQFKDTAAVGTTIKK